MYKKILLALLMISLSVTGYIYYEFTYRGEVESPPLKHYTNREALLGMDTFLDQLRPYGELYEAAISGVSAEKQYGTYVVPGLKSTRTLCGNNGGEIAICTSMTPQGIAVSEKYIFVSSYCHTKKHNSVVYVINKDTHRFVKEIVLPGKPHVGSLAYDEKNDILWVCGSGAGLAQANALSMEAVDSYSLSRDKKPVEYTFRNHVLEIPRSSFMTYNKENLYIGFFTTSQNGVLKKYQIEEDGNIFRSMFSMNGLAVESGLAIDSATIPKQSQGMCFYYDKLFMSQSLGIFPSRLMLFDNALDKKKYRNESALQYFKLPRMLEQVYIYEDELYMIFESAAYAYRDMPGIFMDRIIKINLNDLKKMVNEDLKEEREEEKRQIRLDKQKRTMENWKKLSEYPWISDRIELLTL